MVGGIESCKPGTGMVQKRRSVRCFHLVLFNRRGPFEAQGGEAVLEVVGAAKAAGGTPHCPHPVPPQHTVLILSESRQRHVEDPLLGPTSFGGYREHLGG